MDYETFWNILYAFCNILHAFWNILLYIFNFVHRHTHRQTLGLVEFTIYSLQRKGGKGVYLSLTLALL